MSNYRSLKKCQFLLFITLFLILSVSCGTVTYEQYMIYQPVSNPTQSQLQIRELQVKTYDIKNKDIVFKAILNVLQDDGYTVKNLDTNLGYFNAVKEVRRVHEKGFPLKDIYEATINASEFGNQTKVRVSFYYKCHVMPFHNFFASVDEKELGNTEIYDTQFYQDFFSKVDKAIYIENQKL
jgi:hypothetical protein